MSPDDDALVFVVDRHVAIHVVGQSVDVRRILVLGLKPNILTESSIEVIKSKSDLT